MGREAAFAYHNFWLDRLAESGLENGMQAPASQAPSNSVAKEGGRRTQPVASWKKGCRLEISKRELRGAVYRHETHFLHLLSPQYQRLSERIADIANRPQTETLRGEIDRMWQSTVPLACQLKALFSFGQIDTNHPVLSYI